jgi:hypothetical protein
MSGHLLTAEKAIDQQDAVTPIMGNLSDRVVICVPDSDDGDAESCYTSQDGIVGGPRVTNKLVQDDVSQASVRLVV